MINLTNNATILFQGDSITDTGRDLASHGPNDPRGLGKGYASMLAGRLLDTFEERQLRIFNRGISGNKVTDLYSRWQRDGLDLNPDVISILIGVNDTWHGKTGGIGVPVDRYENVYRALLADTRNSLPDIQLVLCEPFVLLCGAVTEDWLDEMAERREIVRKLARDYGATFVPFQSALDAKLSEAAPEHWLDDGVHPTMAGHAVLADCWWDQAIGVE